eukprot:999822_1
MNPIMNLEFKLRQINDKKSDLHYHAQYTTTHHPKDKEFERNEYQKQINLLGESIACASSFDESSKRKKKHKSSKTNTKKKRQKSQQNKTTKTLVCCDMNKDQTAMVIDGYFRAQFKQGDNKPGQLPKDIVDMICL